MNELPIAVTRRSIGVIAGAVAAVSLAGCAGGGTSTGAGPDATTGTAEATTAAYSPTTGDFVVSLKTTAKQCFGSAGCNVTVEPEIAKTGFRVTSGGTTPFELPSEGTIDITYTIKGDESGPVIETVTLDLADGMYSAPETYLSTASTGVKPKVEVTDLEYTA
jgi:hypothetical protein